MASLRMNSRQAAFVTGSGSGLGKAISKKLLSLGYAVFGGVLNADEARTMLDELGEGYLPIVIDVRSEDSACAAARTVAGELQAPQRFSVFNVAGVVANGPLAELSEREFRHILEVNLLGIHNVSRAFLPLLTRATKASIVNISSASGSRTLPFTVAYSASKYGVEALTAGMRLEFAPFGISAASVAPAMINTPMTDKIMADLSKTPLQAAYVEPMRRLRERAVQSFKNGIAIGTVVDVAIKASQAKSPSRRYEIHQNYWRDVILMRLLPTRVRESMIRSLLGLKAQQRH